MIQTEDYSDNGNAIGKNWGQAKSLQVKAILHSDSEPFCAKALSFNIRKFQAEYNPTVSNLKKFNDWKG